jgi:hypothetical protein
MAVMNEMRMPLDRLVPDGGADGDAVSLMLIAASIGASGCRATYVAQTSVHEWREDWETLSAFAESVEERQSAVRMTFF